MKRILIYMDIIKYGEYDIFDRTSAEEWVKLIKNYYQGNCFNVGNKLWFQGIISEISSAENEISYWNPTMTADEINAEYDLIIAPMANIFSIGYISLMERIAGVFSLFKIPVFVIACGVQADSYDDLTNLCEAIREPATKLIKSVYNTGGEFALRGYFTKEFFDKLGFHSAVVTGCPSMFQMGRDFVNKINWYKKVEKEEFKPAVNGVLGNHYKCINKYSSAEFFDQDKYFHILNDQEYGKNIKELCRIYGYHELEIIAKKKVKLFPDMNSWMLYLKRNGFNFSYGERIHGNIMAILSGIPAVVNVCDSRTQEMAEFFHIPFVLFERTNKKDIYELYLEADYSEFVKNYAKKYDGFEKFLSQCNITDSINNKNTFWSERHLNDFCLNEQFLNELDYKMRKTGALLRAYCILVEVYRKLRGIN